MGFWSALGQGVEQYGIDRLKNGRHHGGLRQAIGNAISPQDANPYNPQMANNPQLATSVGDVATAPANPPPATPQSGPPTPTSMNSVIDPEASMQGAPDLSMNSSPDDGVDMMGSGKVVTSPTLAMVGDKGPEAVVPLTDQPGAKITPGSLGAGARTRWGHPAGPVASKRSAPIRSLLPVKPNAPFR